jgi:hypothetical protein
VHILNNIISRSEDIINQGLDFGFLKSETYELNLYGEAMIIVKAIFENKKRFALQNQEEKDFTINKNDIFNQVENEYVKISYDPKEYQKQKNL